MPKAFWGAAIVLFLVKAINLHNAYEQKKWIEISSQVENGWFFLRFVLLRDVLIVHHCPRMKVCSPSLELALFHGGRSIRVAS
jgi:hypothetical protein